MTAKGQLPERCIVTILHYDIVGSTRHIAECDPEDARDLLAGWLAPAKAAVTRAGGFVVDPEGDGGLAVFGWPIAREDHADRALAAAFDVQHQSQTLQMRAASGEPIAFRIGVHSGLVFFWREDGRARVSGVPVHLAAALQKTARPGQVLFSAKTRGLCRSTLAFKLEPRPPTLADFDIDVLSLEGRPRGLTESEFTARYGTPMVGRSEYIAMLRETLPGGAEPGAAALIGDPGIGKSRLAAALMQEAQAAGVAVLAHYGDGQETTTPFAAARALMAKALGDAMPTDAEALASVLSRAGVAAETIADITPLLNAAAFDDKRRDGQTATALARALAMALRALTNERPISVLVEDLHLVDAESREFLRILAAATAPATSLLVTARPEAAADAHAIARTIIRLPALPDEDMATLATQLWRGAPLAPETMRELLRRADGLPFALEQIISSLDPGEPPTFDRLPLGLQSLIYARVNRLDETLRACVQTLAVLGDETAIDIAADTTGLSESVFQARLEALEDARFIHIGANRSIRFRHALLAQACRTMLPRRQSEALHGKALAAIERRRPNDPSQYGRLAYHAAHAGDDIKALDYYWQAGRHARRQSARQSMKLIFDQAMALTARAPAGAEHRFVDFVLLAFESMHQIGEFERMMPLLRRTVDLTRAAGQREKVCTALSHLAMAHWLDALYGEGVAYAEEALEIAKALDHLPLRYYAQHNLAALLHVTGNVDRAVALMGELCAMFAGEKRAMRLGGVEIPGALSRGFMAEFLVDIGRYREAVDAGSAALDIAQAEREPFSEVMSRIGLGEAFLHNSEPERAVDCLIPAKQMLEHFGLLAADPTVCGHLGAALARCGRGEEALALTQRVFDLERISTPRAMHALWAGHTEARCAALGPIEALDAANSGVAFARERGAAGSLVQALGLRMRILAEIDNQHHDIACDLREQQDICARFGLVAWAPGLASL